MAQSIDRVKYSEVKVDKEQVKLTPNKTGEKHQSYKETRWWATFSQNRMKIICTGLVLVSIMAISITYLIYSRTSWTEQNAVEHDPAGTIPRLRSYAGHKRRRTPDDLGHMNIFINEHHKRHSYQRVRFPVAQYKRRHNPLGGPFLSFMPRVPIFADRLTKQTIIFAATGVYIIPPLINTYGQLFSVAQLIASGYASLVSNGEPLNGNIDMLRYFQPQPIFGSGIPIINPFTGGFTSGVRSHFGSFPETKNYDARSDTDHTQDSEENDDNNNDDYERESDEPDYRPRYNPHKDDRKPYKAKKFIKKTTSTKSTTTTTTTTTTLPPSPPPKCGLSSASRTPFTLNPFQNEFKNPPTILPIAKDCRSDGHCIFSYNIDVYDTRLAPFDQLIPECASKPRTIFITYNGQVPGPTFVVPAGHESIVRFNNGIGTYFRESFSPCSGTRKGRPISVHHHGSASAPPYDGWAEDETCLNETKEYVYPNNRPATEWYHDHALHITADNAYYGLAGLYLGSSKVKHGGCGEPWNLEDIEEKHCILQDKVLDSSCQLYMDKDGFDEESFYGDINLVSGIPFPLMHLEPKWYRFRFLNAAVSRPYLLKIKNAAFQDIGHLICKIIAADAGYRRQPVAFSRAGILIGVAERYEMVCDFTLYKGQTLYLWNDFDDDWMKDVPYFCYSHFIAKIQVSSENPVSSPKFDETLTTVQPEKPIERVLTAADIAKATEMALSGKFHRRMQFGRGGGQWVINGETWDSFRLAAADIGQNTWELWKFQSGGGWFHPVHMHLVDFYIIDRDRDGGVHDYEKLSPKDILYLGPSQKIYVLMRFGPHKGDYMFHCHNLIHEDDDMMRAFRVIDSNNGLTAPSEPFISNTFAKIVYSNWKYVDPLLTEVAARPTILMPEFNTAYRQKILEINIYRIFYPKNNTDIPLGGFTNPWKARWCPV